MRYLYLGLFALLFCACQNQQVISTTEEKTEIEVNSKVNHLKGKWELDYLSPVSGKDIKQLYKIQKPYLTFVDESKVAGNNGCNNIAGEYQVKDRQITFFTDQFKSTRMFCEGVDESVFVNMLKTINGFDVIFEGEKLVLLTGDIVSMSFVKVDK